MNKKVFYILLFFIIIFGLFLRLKYTNFHAELSSDEGESLLLAKSIFTGNVLLQWSYYRPFLLPLLWGLLFKLGFGETAIHLTVIIFSLIGIFYICLLGEYLFNKKTGLIAALLYAIFSQDILYSGRVLLNTPSMALWVVGIYYFVRSLDNDNKSLYLCGVISGISVLIYNQMIPMFLLFLIYLIFTKGILFFKEKEYRNFILIFTIIYLINFIFSYIMYKNPFKMLIYGLWLSYAGYSYFGLFNVLRDIGTFFYISLGTIFLSLFLLSLLYFIKPIKFLFNSLYNYLKKNTKIFYSILFSIILLIFIFIILKYFTRNKEIITQFIITNIFTFFILITGIYILYKLKYYFSYTSKKIEKLDINLLFLIWVFIIPIFIFKVTGHFEGRYFMPIFIPMFILIALSINKLTQYSKYTTIFVILILIFGIYLQINNTNKIVNNFGFSEGLNEFGKWIQKNTNEKDIIVGPWNSALAYYMNRQIYYYPHGRYSSGIEYEKFDKEMKQLKPKYIIIYELDKYKEYNDYYKNFLQENKQYNLIYSFVTKNSNTNLNVYSI